MNEKHNIEPQPTPTEWDMAETNTTAIKDIQNNKDVKYCREIKDEYGQREANTDTKISLEGDKLSSAYFQPKFIKRLHQLTKATQADNINIKLGDGYPMVATFVKDGESQGSYMIAPKWEL